MGLQVTLKMNQAVRLYSSPLCLLPWLKGLKGALLVNLTEVAPYKQAEVVSEPESEGELSAIKSKRTASEVGFSIPLAKRPELAEYSVTESESDTDVVSPSRLPTSGPTSAHGKGTAAVHNCDDLVLTSAPHRRSSRSLTRR